MVDTIVESRKELMISPTANANSKPFSRTAHFLKPSLSLNHQGISELPSSLSLPPTFDLKNPPLTVNFHGWRSPSKNWKEWVEKLALLHAPIWKKAGIHDAIFNSTYRIHTNSELILGVAERWCPQTNSFCFPWGEATITLEDMLIAAGYSVLGSSVFDPLETEESKAVQEGLVRERQKFNKTPARKAHHYAWMKTFMDSGSEIEHEAFLSLWLSKFVLPTSQGVVTECVFPVAVHLARGTRIALAPAVLASIYRDLSLLKQNIVSLSALDAGEKLVVTTYAPFQLVLVWVWERFEELSPQPNLLKIGEPRFARWKLELNSTRCYKKSVRSLVKSSKESFNWRPYTKPLENWDFPKFYMEEGMWFSSDSDSDLDDDLLSFILCLRVSKLVGMELNCREQYLPHRVARQFGFDQDIPGLVGHSSCSCYFRQVGYVKCFIPSRLSENDVTTRYLEWWSTLEYQEQEKAAAASLNRPKQDDDGDCCITLKNSKSLPRSLEKVAVQDSSDVEDNLTISQLLKLKQKQDVSTRKQCGNGKNCSEETLLPQIATKTPVAVEMAKSNYNCNLIPSQSRSFTPCCDAVNGEDVDPENVRVNLGGCQSGSSSVGGNDLEVKEARKEENVMVKEKEDVESANECGRAKLEKNMDGNPVEAEFIMGLEYRIQRLEKLIAARKALLFR